MLSIQYEEHCMRCHRLEFDERFPKQVVPHDEPAVVHTFLEEYVHPATVSTAC